MVEPEFIEHVCAMIVDRATLDVVAKHFDIPYFMLHRWIHEDIPRLKMYTAALESRAHGLSEVVLGAMLRSATSDVRKLYDGEGKLIDPQKLPDDMADVVSSVKDVTSEAGTRTREYKLNDRSSARSDLARVLGLFRDRVDVNVSGNLAQRLDAAARRRKSA
jgi:hypothetical protein